MMDRRFPLSAGWALAAWAAVALVALAMAPPFLGAEAGAWVRHAYSAVCHQIPSRSLHIDGTPVALCHRCTGVAVGLVAGLLAAPLAGGRVLRSLTRGPQGRWLLAAAVPAVLDWLVGAAGVWANTPVSRTMTGAVFGVVAGTILAANLLAPPRRRTSPSVSPSS